ncbi:MAG: 50S ribosomal protein L7Ae-like protein [Clostridiales bacterium]|nr:50S ribosomal protein L7Ae-like protein [Clostridiales bacterium]
MLSRLRTGDKLVGVNQARKAVIKGTAKAVFIAEDAERRIVNSIRELCESNDIEVVPVPTMKELGEACGINVGAAAAVLLG